jgi:hypothetical protein
MWYLLQDLNHLYLGQELIIPSPQQTNCMTMSRGPPLRYLLRPENVASIPALRPLIQNKLVQALLPKWQPESFGVPCQGGWFSSLYGWKGEISSFNSSMYWPMLSSGSLHGKANKNCEINVNQQMIVFWESCKPVCLLSLFSMSSFNTVEHLTFPFSIFLLSSLARQVVC